MSSTITVQALLDRHNDGLAKHKKMPLLPEMKKAGKTPHIAVVTCADPRCIPENFLHLDTAEVIVIRNVGGNGIAALSDIVGLDNLVTLSDVMIIKHTDCGTTYFKDADVKKVLKERAPEQAEKIDAMSFGEMTDSLESSVAQNLHFLRTSDLVRKELAEHIHGFVYDIQSGKLTPVK